MSEPRVAVVGAGVVGLACAWELRRRGATGRRARARRGRRRRLARQHRAGSRRASPTRCRRPGWCARACASSSRGGEAFVLRPSLDPAFARWLWSFRRSCSPARFDAGVRALLALNRRTLELFDAYREAGVAFEMHAAGLVVAARTLGGLDLYRRTFRRLRELGYEGGAIDELDAAALAALEPALDARRRRRRPARARRPLRAPGGADRRPRRAPAGRRRRDPRGLRAARARPARTAAGRWRRRRRAGDGGAGRRRRRPARPRRCCAASACACRCWARAATASRSPAAARRRAMRSTWPRRSSG